MLPVLQFIAPLPIRLKYFSVFNEPLGIFSRVYFPKVSAKNHSLTLTSV